MRFASRHTVLDVDKVRIWSGNSHQEHVGVGVGKGAEVGHGVFDERPEDEAEADAQVNVDGLDEAVGVG